VTNTTMEQLVIVLVIAAVSLVKWLMEKSAEQRSQRETAERVEELERQNPRQRPAAPPIRAPRPIAPSPMSEMEDAARRLREALGLPAESDAPPRAPRPSKRAPTPPPLQSKPVESFLERAEPAVADLERRVAAEPPPRPARKPAKRHKVEAAAETTTSARMQLDALLHSREGLRQVVLAREILGPPKGLES
jgi:hypothetical protein